MQIVKIESGQHPVKDHLDRTCDNARAIVNAVNNTYGVNVNPEAVSDMLEALKKVIEYF